MLTKEATHARTRTRTYIRSASHFRVFLLFFPIQRDRKANISHEIMHVTALVACLLYSCFMRWVLLSLGLEGVGGFIMPGPPMNGPNQTGSASHFLCCMCLTFSMVLYLYYWFVPLLLIGSVHGWSWQNEATHAPLPQVEQNSTHKSKIQRHTTKVKSHSKSMEREK